MVMTRSWARPLLVCAAAAGLLLSVTGCGYIRNVRDDIMDVGSFAIGYVPPVAPGGEKRPKAVGFLPPAIGVYAQVTDFLHFGALYKATGDLEWDRRGAGVTVDVRRKFGIGPLHDVYVKQTPVWVNAYKTPDNEMDGWRAHMRALSDPIFGVPAKTLIFEPESVTLSDWYYGGEEVSWTALPWLWQGWQDWEFVMVEVAVPEPFILHSGFYVRAGVDPSQVFDLALSIFGIDLYSDAAYKFWGDLKY